MPPTGSLLAGMRQGSSPRAVSSSALRRYHSPTACGTAVGAQSDLQVWSVKGWVSASRPANTTCGTHSGARRLASSGTHHFEREVAELAVEVSHRPERL